MQGNVGHKKLLIDQDKIKQVNWCRRTNLLSFASVLEVSKSTLHRRVKEGYLRPHSSALRPHLCDENKLKRLKFCLLMVDSHDPHDNPSFIDICNYVHIDEKWFYMSKETQWYYMLPSEDEPL